MIHMSKSNLNKPISKFKVYNKYTSLKKYLKKNLPNCSNQLLICVKNVFLNISKANMF